jgi:hypothetical protein
MEGEGGGGERDLFRLWSGASVACLVIVTVVNKVVVVAVIVDKKIVVILLLAFRSRDTSFSLSLAFSLSIPLSLRRQCSPLDTPSAHTRTRNFRVIRGLKSTRVRAVLLRRLVRLALQVFLTEMRRLI